jgi:hypothetical protein
MTANTLTCYHIIPRKDKKHQEELKSLPVIDDTRGKASWRYVIINGEASLSYETSFMDLLEFYRSKYPIINTAGYNLNLESMTFITIKPKKIITANI